MNYMFVPNMHIQLCTKVYLSCIILNASLTKILPIGYSLFNYINTVNACFLQLSFEFVGRK